MFYIEYLTPEQLLDLFPNYNEMCMEEIIMELELLEFEDLNKKGVNHVN